MRAALSRALLVVPMVLTAACGGDAFHLDQDIESRQQALGELMELTPANSGLSFGIIQVGSSATQSFTVRNIGAEGSLLQLGPMQISGAFASEFTVVQGCPGPLPAGASCAVTVRAAPVSPGSRNASLMFTTNEQTQFGFGFGFVPLAAIGVAPAIQVTPAAIDFGMQLVGTTTVRSLTISNPSDVTLTVSGVQWTSGPGSFDFQNWACSFVPPRGACTAQVRFFPSASGPQNASFQVLSNAYGTSPVVSLTGTGYVPPPRLEVSPSELDFGGVLLGSSATRYLTFSNTGGSPMQVTDFVTGGDFSLGVGDCGPTPFLLAAGQECMAPVVFTPSAAGPQARTIILPDTGAQVSMFGAGVARADLQISMAGPAEAKVKDDVSYTITVTNAGPNAATNVVVTDWLPDFTRLVSVVAPDFTCVTPPPGTNGSVSCELASLGAGQSRTLTVTAQVESGGKSMITNVAGVSSPTNDPDVANNTASIQTVLKGKK